MERHIAVCRQISPIAPRTGLNPGFQANRLARSMKDLQDIVHELKEKGFALKPLSSRSSSAAGKASLDMLGVFAEFETVCGASASLKECLFLRGQATSK